MKIGERGVIPVLILLAAIGLIAFVLISNTSSFKDQLFATLYPKSESQASGPTMYVMDAASLETLPHTHQVAFQSLQGIANKINPQIWINKNTANEFHDSNWRDLIVGTYGLTTANSNDYNWYFSNFKPLLQGYILYDYTNNRHSMNVALSLAGVRNAVVVDVNNAALVSLMQSLQIPQIDDVRTWNYTNLVTSSYWSQINKSGILQLDPAVTLANSRDFAVMANFAVFWDDFNEDPTHSITEGFYNLLNPGAAMYGFGFVDANHPETEFVGHASSKNIGVIPTQSSGNLSVINKYQLSTNLTNSAPENLPSQSSKHTVAFVMSDGDNIDFWIDDGTHPTANPKKWYNSTQRGTIPMGWTISPAMYYVAPPIMKYIYDVKTTKDYFLAGPSGWSYFYPSVVVDKTGLGNTSGSMMGTTNMKSFVDLDFVSNQGFTTGVLNPFTSSSNVDGGFFFDLDWNQPSHGTILWTNTNKPIIPVERFGYDPAVSIPQQITNLTNLINSRTKSTSSPSGYTIVYGQVWTVSYSDFVTLKNSLAAVQGGKSIQVVRPDTLLRMATTYVPH